MTVFKKIFKKFLGFEEEEEQFEEESINEEKLMQQKSYYGANIIENAETNKLISEQNNDLVKQAKEIILYPKTFAEACDVVEKLELGYTVVVNMDDVDIDTCKRIADFVLGAIYVLEGDVEKVSKKVFRFFTNR